MAAQGGAGELVRTARLAAGLSQSELAHRAGTSQAAVSVVETGKADVTVNKAVRLIEAAGWTLVVAPADRQGVRRRPQHPTEATIPIDEERRAEIRWSLGRSLPHRLDDLEAYDAMIRAVARGR